MPEFLDFVFPFGKREDAEDFHFGALKTDHRLGNPRTAISIPELGRSGQQYQMCYNIRSVEPYKGDSTWPWSIRQCAIFHSFDVENGRTVWIMIKGNLRMRNRIAEAVKSNNMDETSSIRSYKSVSASFASSLNVHSNLCDMATDNWRWYINFLEGEFQKLTRYALHAPVETTSMAQAHLRAPIRSDTAPLPRIQRQWSLIPGQRWLARSQKSQTVRSAGMDDPESVNILLEQRNEKSNVKVPDDGDFSFSKLQGIQHLEEKANEALLVIEMNVNILQELSVYYTDLEHRQIWPANFRDETVEVLSQFQKLVSSAVSDFKMQQSRLETLIRMLSNRKDLVCGHELLPIAILTQPPALWYIESQERLNEPTNLCRGAGICNQNGKDDFAYGRHRPQDRGRNSVNANCHLCHAIFLARNICVGTKHNYYPHITSCFALSLTYRPDGYEHGYSPISNR